MNIPNNKQKGRYIHGEILKNTTIRRKQKQTTIFKVIQIKNPL